LKLIKIFIILALLLFSTNSFAKKNSLLEISNIRYGKSYHRVRIVFDLNKASDFRIFSLESPYRLVVDLPRAKWNKAKSAFTSNNIIKDYRSGDLTNGLTRVIFDLKKPAIVKSAFNLKKNGFNKDRIVIDLEISSKNIFYARKDDIYGNKNLSNKSGKNIKKTRDKSLYAKINRKIVNNINKHITKPKRKPIKQYVIVLDAGHGGGDPGAVQKNIQEKNITLAVVKEIRRQMEEAGKYKVVLTRDRDFYVKLRERLNISRRVNADLFISIHADKISRRKVRGTSIYTLSEKSSDKETARLAKDENNSGFVAGVDLNQESQDVANILLDLAMREKMNESNIFAKMINNSLLREKIRLLPHSHRSAGFAVLKAPDVPSVLIETGFISNPQEVRLLNSSSFRRKIAKAIVNGTNNYFKKMQALQKF